MSSTKLFNFNFLKQNIKKSKGTVILSLVIVPILISIYMVTSGLNNQNVEFVSHELFGTMTLIFMYIIPFVYSVILFGFVFKKPSTDFMNSMPINRKTMFITNTVGGIFLIALIHLLAGCTVFLWSFAFKNIVVFPLDVLETMLISLVSYIFVFVSANLAMTISGTLITQFVVTALILFLVPFCVEEFNSIKQDTIYGFGDDLQEDYDISIIDGYQTTHYNLLDEVKDYTMPFKLPRYGFEFSEKTILKMLVLSAFYSFIGFELYKRRKMEDNEESFGSLKLHLLVKALTLIPVILFANFANLSEDITAFVVIVIISAIYYFVFDLIVKRKVPIKVTVLSFILTIFVIQASISTLRVMNKTKSIDIDSEDIKSISIGKNRRARTGLFSISYSGENNLVFDGDYFIKDSEALDMILKAKLSAENKVEDDYYSYPSEMLYFNIKLASGKEYYTRFYVYEKDYDKIVDYLRNDDDYMKHIKNNILENSGVYLSNDQILVRKTEKIVEKELKDNLPDTDFSKLKDGNVYYIEKKVYNNHKLYTYKIPTNVSDNSLKAIAEFSNETSLDNIKGYKYGLYASVYDRNKVIGNIDNAQKLLEFMEENAREEFNPNKKYYIISGDLETNDGYKSFVFYTNKIEEIDDITYE